jgi:hypothetical protein
MGLLQGFIAWVGLGVFGIKQALIGIINILL